MHPLNTLREHPPDPPRKEPFATEELLEVVKNSGPELEQQQSWPNGPPPTGPKPKYNHGVSPTADSASHGSVVEARTWNLHSFGNSLQLQRAKEPSPPPSKRRRLSYDHYSPPKPSSIMPGRPHQRTQRTNEESDIPLEFHRRSPPPRGRGPPPLVFSSSDRGYDSWRPENSRERKASLVKSTLPNLPRSLPVLPEHTLNHEQETNSLSARFNVTAKSKSIRAIPDSVLVGSQTNLPWLVVNGVAKTSAVEVGDAPITLIPPLINETSFTARSHTDNMALRELPLSPQIGLLEGKSVSTSVVGADSPRLRPEAGTGSETPLTCASRSTSSSIPLIHLSTASRSAIHKAGERDTLVGRSSSRLQAFAGFSTGRTKGSSEERASSTGTPDTTSSTKSQEKELIALLSMRAADDPDLKERMGRIARKEATADDTTLFNDEVASLKRELKSQKSKHSPCEVTITRMSLTRESALISEVEVQDGRSEEPLSVPEPSTIDTENHSLEDSASGAVTGTLLGPPDLESTNVRSRPSTTASNTTPKALSKLGPKRKACEKCRKGKRRCKHHVETVPTGYPDARDCEECKFKQILCRRHREPLTPNEAKHALVRTSDSEKPINLFSIKSGQVNHDPSEQPDSLADGPEVESNVSAPSDSPGYDYRQVEDMGPDFDPSKIPVKEKWVVQETPDARSSKAFESDSLVASRDFKAGKVNPGRQNPRNLFTDRNEGNREAGSVPNLPRCLECGRFVYGKPRCLNCDAVHAENTRAKNPTIIPETPEVTGNEDSIPDQSTMPLLAAAESPTPSTQLVRPGQNDTVGDKDLSESKQPHILIPRKRKHGESSSADASEHRATKLVSTHLEGVTERGQSREDAEADVLRQMQIKDTEEMERLVHQNLTLQEELDENQNEKENRARELEQVRKENAVLKNELLSRSAEILEAAGKDPCELKKRSEPSDELVLDTDLILEPYAYNPSNFPPLKPYMPGYRRPRMSTDLYEVAPHLHPDNVFFDKEAKIREIGARPSRKAAFGKVLANSRR